MGGLVGTPAHHAYPAHLLAIVWGARQDLNLLPPVEGTGAHSKPWAMYAVLHKAHSGGALVER